MRKITSHRLTGLNNDLDIEVEDQPGAGGANHKYSISSGRDAEAFVVHHVSFQNGPITEAGINGISNEALVAVVIDRLQGFQSGEFSCRENAIALTKLEEAMHWLQHRTRERLSRGVEGTSAV